MLKLLSAFQANTISANKQTGSPRLHSSTISQPALPPAVWGQKTAWNTQKSRKADAYAEYQDGVRKKQVDRSEADNQPDGDQSANYVHYLPPLG